MTASMIRVDGEVIDASGAIGGIGAGEAVCDDRTGHGGMIVILVNFKKTIMYSIGV